MIATAEKVKLTKVDSFLKWAGGKSYLISEIVNLLPKAGTLIEPFAGSMVISLNATDKYKNFIVADSNADLMGACHFCAPSRPLR
jgi:DNA adenine methylase